MKAFFIHTETNETNKYPESFACVNGNQVKPHIFHHRGTPGWAVGPDLDNLFEVEARSIEDYGTPANPQTREIEITLQGSWNSDGKIHIVTLDPTPLTVASITREVEFGG